MGKLFKQDQGREHHLRSKTEPTCLVCPKLPCLWWYLAWPKPTPSQKQGWQGTKQLMLQVYMSCSRERRREIWGGGGVSPWQVMLSQLTPHTWDIQLCTARCCSGSCGSHAFNYLHQNKQQNALILWSWGIPVTIWQGWSRLPGTAASGDPAGTTSPPRGRGPGSPARGENQWAPSPLREPALAMPRCWQHDLLLLPQDRWGRRWLWAGDYCLLRTNFRM